MSTAAADLRSLSRGEVDALVARLGEKPYRARQIRRVGGEARHAIQEQVARVVHKT